MPVNFVTDPTKAKEIVWKVLLSENRPFITDHVSDHLSGVVRRTVAQIALDELVSEKRAEARMVGDMKTYYGIHKEEEEEENLATMVRREAFLKHVAADTAKGNSRSRRVRAPTRSTVEAMPAARTTTTTTTTRPKQKSKRSASAKVSTQKRRQLVDMICGTSAYPDDDDHDFTCNTSVSSSSS
eukprot:TRINITY_DN450_c7_g1_i1.p1 TRINITY_DN450_c7_g1~~TRINITY_DN450_c7_g1_i1.p1  ORF type:complete len:203 (+),score=43.57 TRINITY_DN450_c7_g1_i1:60-611(+)